MRIDKNHPYCHKTKVYDRNGDKVDKCVWIDDETHEVCLVVTDDEGKVVVENQDIKKRVWTVEGWTYRVDDGEPQPI